MKRVLNALLVVVLMAAVSTAPSGATQIDGPGYPSGTEAKLACTAAYMGLDAAADLPRTSVVIVHFLLSISGDINTSAAGTLGSIDTTGTTYASDWSDDELATADIVATHYGVTRNEAIAFSTGLIIFLAALDGACTGDTVAAPGAPATLGAADANSAALTVSWTAPATDGGAAVTTYTASATDGTDTFTCTSSGLSCQVKGLDYDTDYTVTVTAENTAGPGPIKQALIRTATDPSLTCTVGQVAKWDGSAWACAADTDTDTDTVGALSCASGQVAKWDGSAWACAADTDTDTDTVGGLSCTSGQVAKWDGSAWACAADTDTDTDTVGGLSCSTTQVAAFVDSAWVCRSIALTTDGIIVGSSETTLDWSGSVGQTLSMAIGTDNNPVISYHDNTNGDLKAYVCATTDCSSGTARTLDDTGDVGDDTSIAIGADNNPVISYHDQGESALKVYVCAATDCSSGTARTLDDTGYVGYDTSIAIGADNNPVISYQDNTNDDLKVYVCAATDCSSGTARTLDETGNVGTRTTVAIGADNNPVISYYDTLNNNVKVYVCAATDCSSGTARTLVTNGGGPISMLIGADDNPIIIHSDISGGLQAYACATSDCTSGTNHTLDPAAINGGSSNSVTLGTGDKPVISYYAAHVSGGLNIYTCTATDCSTGFAQNFPTSDHFDQGGHSAIAIGTDNNPVVSYFNSSRSDLRFGRPYYRTTGISFE